jgi:hypothetical protein
MNMHVNERHWRFLGCGEGEGTMVKERGIVLFITNAMEGIKKISKFVNLDGKELDKMSLHLDYNFRVVVIQLSPHLEVGPLCVW